MQDLVEILPDGTLRLNFHPGQWRAWISLKRFVAIIAGTQGGKTSFGPPWLYREIKDRGPGDYIIATPTFALLEKKALPEFLAHFDRYLKLGTYVGSPVRKFTFSEQGAIRTFGSYDVNHPTVVFFGYAEDPESLESMTAKGAWLDEAGQKKFKLGSWEAILRRLSLAQGRVLITTTPYDLGWLKQQFYDKWKAGNPDYDVIRFDSTENPQFPQAEFERARADLPSWKFDLFYRAIFTRPAGMIYDCFDEKLHTCPRFALPDSWDRFLGLDFGGANTAGTFFAEERNAAQEVTGRLYLYRTYKAGGRSAAEHTKHLLKGEVRAPFTVGGSHSEGQWRREFAAGGLVEGAMVQGLPIHEPPIKDVEVGINRVYAVHARSEIIVFDDLVEYLNQKMTYARELDDMAEPTEKIADKATFHYMDAERYIICYIRPNSAPVTYMDSLYS